jgi:hypothetical protein
MEHITADLVAAYSLMGIFIFYQQLWGRDFRGSWQILALLLNLSGLIGTITGLVLLGYFAVSVSWVGAAILGVGGLLGSLLGPLIERFTGPKVIAFAGTIGWPWCAYYLFQHVGR